jgi:phosphoribosylformylglycinamidine synthase PurS subunit
VKVRVTIRRRSQIADPQGTAVGKGLRDLGYDVSGVRIDRNLLLEVEGADEQEVRDSVAEMCERLLANPVMEDYEIEILA